MGAGHSKVEGPVIASPTLLRHAQTDLLNLEAADPKALSPSRLNFARDGIRWLNLSSNRLDALPDFVLTMRNLRALRLINNELTTLPDDLDQLIYLANLDLCRNRIVAMPRVISRIIRLQDLNMQCNVLEDTLATLEPLTGLRNLNFYNNRLRALAIDWSCFPHLLTLDLSQNQLPRTDLLGHNMAALRSLESLALAGNNMTRLPALVLAIPSLRHCDARDNVISQLPPRLQSPLVILRLQSNRLSDIAALCEVSTLEELTLSINAITELPSAIRRLQRLRLLLLDNNALRRLPDALGDLPALQELDVSYNCLVKVPPGLARCPNLRVLHLESNAVAFQRTTARALAWPASLVHLAAMNNAMREAPPLGALPALSHLEFSGNDACGSLGGPHASIFWLDLANNRFRDEDVAAILASPRLSHVNLFRNTLCGPLPMTSANTISTSIVTLNLGYMRGPWLADALFSQVKWPSLKELRMDGLALRAVPVFEAPRLKLFSAANNEIAGDARLAHVQAKLRTLVLSSNAITSCLGVAQTCPRVRELDLSYNALSSIHDLAMLIHLEDLDLSGNNIRSLGRHFRQLAGLRRLKIGANPASLQWKRRRWLFHRPSKVLEHVGLTMPPPKHLRHATGPAHAFCADVAAAHRIAWSQTRGCHDDMQDMVSVVPAVWCAQPACPLSTVFGLFDGHGGSDVSLLVAALLPRMVALAAPFAFATGALREPDDRIGSAFQSLQARLQDAVGWHLKQGNPVKKYVGAASLVLFVYEDGGRRCAAPAGDVGRPPPTSARRASATAADAPTDDPDPTRPRHRLRRSHHGGGGRRSRSLGRSEDDASSGYAGDDDARAPGGRPNEQPAGIPFDPDALTFLGRLRGCPRPEQILGRHKFGSRGRDGDGGDSDLRADLRRTISCGGGGVRGDGPEAFGTTLRRAASQSAIAAATARHGRSAPSPLENLVWRQGNDARPGFGTVSMGAGAGARVLLVISNCGDQRAVLYNGGPIAEVVQSIDHKPYLAAERRRITEAGGFVSELHRLGGILALSRSLGDLSLEPSISADSDVFICRFDPHPEAFLIAACDGLWDVISSQQAVLFAKQDLGRHDFCARAATRLRDYAIGLGSSDNISVVIYKFR